MLLYRVYLYVTFIANLCVSKKLNQSNVYKRNESESQKIQSSKKSGKHGMEVTHSQKQKQNQASRLGVESRIVKKCFP